MWCARVETMKEAPEATNQEYEQWNLATGIEENRSNWRVHPAMKEEAGEGRRAMKAGVGGDEERWLDRIWQKLKLHPTEKGEGGEATGWRVARLRRAGGGEEWSNQIGVGGGELAKIIPGNDGIWRTFSSQGMEFGDLRVIPSHNLTYRCHANFFFKFSGKISPKKKGWCEAFVSLLHFIVDGWLRQTLLPFHSCLFC